MRRICKNCGREEPTYIHTNVCRIPDKRCEWIEPNEDQWFYIRIDVGPIKLRSQPLPEHLARQAFKELNAKSFQPIWLIPTGKP